MTLVLWILYTPSLNTAHFDKIPLSDNFFVEQILQKPAIVYIVDAPQFFVSCFKSLEHVW